MTLVYVKTYLERKQDRYRKKKIVHVLEILTQNTINQTNLLFMYSLIAFSTGFPNKPPLPFFMEIFVT